MRKSDGIKNKMIDKCKFEILRDVSIRLNPFLYFQLANLLMQGP